MESRVIIHQRQIKIQGGEKVNKIFFKLFISVNFLILSLVFSCSFRPAESNLIRIKGSDTMFRLTERLAEEFMKRNPDISIYVEGGGTATGIRSLIKDDIDICTASRNLRPEEAKLLADYYQSLAMVFLVAKDALSIYVHKNNPVKQLTLKDIKDIYQCKIRNWKALGGLDMPIIPVTRNPNSGTYLYFRDHILLGEDYCPDILVKPTTESIIEFVRLNEDAIGYGAEALAEDVHTVSVENIEPTIENSQNDTYPITRYLHFFTRKNPGGSIKKFIDWTLSSEGQKIVSETGFIPLWKFPGNF